MKTFTCQCGNTLHFANVQCVSCGLMLGFIPQDNRLSAFTTNQYGNLQASSNGLLFKKCKNYSEHNVCNWMVPLEDSHDYCVSCRLNEVIPDLDDVENRVLWAKMELAKRRLLYTLLKLNLPLVDRTKDPINGLGFAFLRDKTQDSFGNELTVKSFVTTGHANGLITINLNEADDSARVDMREKMNERYRTLLGHFRHESGHYYWDRLISDSDKIDEFRRLFGDERLDYVKSMETYYAKGPNENWQNVWISAYASMHPWEDWAETWAHYLHMLDTLETANDYDFSISGNKIASPIPNMDSVIDQIYTSTSFTHLFNDWCQLTKVLNALNRSMGLDDAYPFVISISALDKLRFIHEVVLDSEMTSLSKGAA
ncbi:MULTISPECIES: zinc-binding metallopeptidase family protein [Alteromonadaceae]|uniref:zinc-binding metallopeptidase family protein n=1 Tax=Alteromonadaceae TaxID=72275 RepID=UPI001C083E54|nr:MULTISPECIES: putative zinc-binding metallopeptidase [Aliiglaciecola]MBU2877013.1 putative zinc-binding peptidase [Aliiglaciecola lipolytica]MDO6712292.1 putative zinc-binding metallopeptidase [Aliiglaciecola sp. 2_MG-2023]MDO6753302.1 putative zinc-binding metallopeptidase [Aliiglaciecola sp. 1_MG-2023]